ncbi:ABC transporter ATP-binding protein [Rhodobacteraceae bacterium M382]|nr:ABC transporter ATP-binding protein [Rhodobacteraceae bacterium M382]
MLLSVRNVTKTYSGQNMGRAVLRDVSLDLAAGDTLALTGESGSGKSTLLHLVGALDTLDSGEITLMGQTYGALGDTGRAALRRQSLALVFQQFNLIPSLSVLQNVTFQARLAGQHDQAWVNQLIDRLGLSDLTDRFPEQLSGGQQQRVAIGRALAPRPLLLLADEPTGNLDETSSQAVLDLMLDLVADSGTALFLVTHSQQIANRLNRRLHLSGGHLQ